MQNYEVLSRIGEGAFGEIFRARSKTTGEIVALKRVGIKRVRDGIPKRVIREIMTMQRVTHSNIVKLYEYFRYRSSVILACEYMERDLQKVLDSKETPFSQAEIKCIMKMLLRGVNSCHEHNVIHRDLKPSNLLFNSSAEIKISDFGQSRFDDHKGDGYSHQIATRWYRAPELLYGSRSYGREVDMWAVGCIFAELLLHVPMFPGETDIDQLYRIIKILGTPNERNWPEVTALPDFGKIIFSEMPAVPLSEVIPDVPANAIELLEKMLVYRSSKRIGAREALLSDYFFTSPLPVPPSNLQKYLPKTRPSSCPRKQQGDGSENDSGDRSGFREWVSDSSKDSRAKTF
eukprot:175432_1